MQPKKSLNQLFNEQFFDDTSSNSFSDDEPNHNLNENPTLPIRNNPMATLHLVHYGGLTYDETASSEASIDEEEVMRANLRWTGESAEA